MFGAVTDHWTVIKYAVLSMLYGSLLEIIKLRWFQTPCLMTGFEVVQSCLDSQQFLCSDFLISLFFPPFPSCFMKGV